MSIILEASLDFSPTSLETIHLTGEWLPQIFEIEKHSFPRPWTREMLFAELSKDITLSLGIKSGTTLIAYAISHVLLDELHILTLAVRSSSRLQGFGKMLLEKLLSEAVGAGCSYVTLEVREGNASARKLYAKLDFLEVGLRKHYYRDNLENALLLRKTVVI